MQYKVADIPHKKIWGRCSSVADELILFWTGSGIELNVRAGHLYADIEAVYDVLEIWIDVFIDDQRIMHFPLLKGKHRYQLMNGFDSTHAASIRVVRSTQSMAESCASVVKISSFETDGEFVPVKERKFSLEFIGDSITSGEGSFALSREEWMPTVFDHVSSYTYMTAKILDADYNIISQSGWGLFASWEGSCECSMQKIYPYVCAAQNCEESKALGCMEKWDFTDFETDAVIINLGTNDSSAMKLDIWDEDEFLEQFMTTGNTFLGDIRKNNPGAKIIWAYGMLGNDMEDVIRQIIDTYNKETGDNVTYLRLPDCSDIHVGARLHPDPEGHRLAAKVLSEYLKEILA
ncbi:SGNH/GDSL hydrolase family protein [Butyrivibrio sp. INlla16]|uniref:SGNH/GDSL hydrolase family protein n=1 Tax=Butyrivibrio sp. INlla16 TaxID=1520807 RepID=UPI0008831A1C|nr:SGNH/GDSL hydrolase family protein [Butyrivibrio sp. INlla16]SDB53195.1 GDSL-like Lipase/Acylhydrolase [Butyrivibrio sp. INlla16]